MPRLAWLAASTALKGSLAADQGSDALPVTWTGASVA